MDTLILVNEHDECTGFADKLTAHKLGLLHRAFSIVILKKETNKTYMLLQRRALKKYHGAGLWSNSCCSHFLPGVKDHERLIARLKFEMGIESSLSYIGKFQYFADLGTMREHEIDHVYLGTVDSKTQPIINTDEVMEFAWVDVEVLKHENLYNKKYSPWFAQVCAKVFKSLA